MRRTCNFLFTTAAHTMKMMSLHRNHSYYSTFWLLLWSWWTGSHVDSFQPVFYNHRTPSRIVSRPTTLLLWGSASSPSSSSSSSSPTTASFIDTELRGAAMRLHTREQSPREGQAPSEPRVNYTPTVADYLQFLIDSQHIYQAFEDVVDEREALAALRNTGLERTKPLEQDVQFLCQNYGLERFPVGMAGRQYAQEIRALSSNPQFICHYYNFYFAHTAGGRMIGKQMSALLLDKKTLEFYKWDGDLNEIKQRVKGSIEAMVIGWNDTERKDCVDATAAAFQGGGAVNAYLMQGRQATSASSQ